MNLQLNRSKLVTATASKPMYSDRPNVKPDPADANAAVDHAVMPTNIRPRPMRASRPALCIHSPASGSCSTSSSSAPRMTRMSLSAFRAHPPTLMISMPRADAVLCRCLLCST